MTLITVYEGQKRKPHDERRLSVKRSIFVLTLLAVLVPTMAQAHGGGCRKSSPPGQCCHMDNSVGRVHCH